jgi:RNase_H superfamily
MVTWNSIKEVAPACGFRWSQPDVDGQSAQLLYLQWLETGDDQVIARVQQYNREDVQATHQPRRWGGLAHWWGGLVPPRPLLLDRPLATALSRSGRVPIQHRLQ